MTPVEIAATIRVNAARVLPLASKETNNAYFAAIDIEENTGEVHDILNAVRELTGTVEESGLPEAEIDRMREAYGAACALYHEPMPLPADQFRHEPVPERDMLALLSAIIEFHAGEAIESSKLVIKGHDWITARALVITTEDGRNFAVTISAID